MNLLEQYQQQHTTFCQRNLNLDLTRGKPSSEQLSLSNEIDGILKGNYLSDSGVDTRNYGGLEGIIEARALGGQMLGLPKEQVLAQGNSSLTLMYQLMSIAMHHGLNGEGSAWNTQDKVSFICPVPGYDRHFTVCEDLGIDMLTVDMNEHGPDMDAVEALIDQDPSIRGMWCVPKYSNPTGATYSDETVQRIANLGKKAHPSFRVMWDNAYAVHNLNDTPDTLANIMTHCQQAGTENSVIQFASTSKITLAGAGVAFIGGSEHNLQHYVNYLGNQAIGPDKVNQLRHVRFFEGAHALEEHMKRHANIVKPRFDAVLNHLKQAFEGTDLGQWETPNGGYFISFNTQPGLAKRVVELAQEAGVKLTPAGATYPYGHDPLDRNIRIAPTVPSVDQVKDAMGVFVNCVQLATAEQTPAE